MTSHSSRGMIRATGMSVPDKVVTNADFERILDTSDEWITTRTGIKERRMCAEGQNTADMAAEACRLTLADAAL
ncbi:MAG TPA: 3-oxoacyl-ACP synthase, partial [Gemmatimonadota bacterium]|nr:3-oxoacyl-ACP synthase [Gemmatimonadota bacterium]